MKEPSVWGGAGSKTKGFFKNKKLLVAYTRATEVQGILVKKNAR